MLHAEKIDDKGETKAHRKTGRKMVLKQMGRFLGNSLTGLWQKRAMKVKCDIELIAIKVDIGHTISF